MSLYNERLQALENEVLALKAGKLKLANTIAVATKKTSVSLTVLEDVYASSQAVICTLTPSSSTDGAFMSCAYVDTASLGYTFSSSTGAGNTNAPMFVRTLADNSKHIYRFFITEYWNESVSLPTTLTYTLTFLATSDFSLTTSYETIDWAG